MLESFCFRGDLLRILCKDVVYYWRSNEPEPRQVCKMESHFWIQSKLLESVSGSLKVRHLDH